MPAPTPPNAPAAPARARRSTATSASTTGTGCATATTRRCIAYLEAENAYADAMLAPVAALRDRIFDEIRGRIQETDESAPVPDGAVGVLHAHRRRPAVRDPLPAAARRRRRRAGPARRERRSPRATTTSRSAASRSRPTTASLAYSDRRHRRRALHACASATSTPARDLADVVDDVTYGLAWADDARTCFYVRPDDAMRPNEVWRHRLGTAAGDDVLVFREDDERFFLGVERTRSGSLRADRRRRRSSPSEAWFVPTATPDADAARRRAARARARVHGRAPLDARARRPLPHRHEQRGGARNFKLVAAPVADPGRGELDRARRRTATTCASTRSTRSPITSC